ncbi:MAG: hypothetical protein H7Y18_16965 [Clostridiaceae bacterium]|nr:hypothetical protein [Clostridiaceae bacterium]
MSLNFSGIIRCSEYCNGISEVKIEVLDARGSLGKTLFSDSLGEWELKDIEENGYVTFYKEGYLKKEFKVEELPKIVRLLEVKLIGYQEKLWFRQGEETAVYVNSSMPFKASLFRHGLNKECVLDTGVHEAVEQVVPDSFFVETGLDWKVSFRYTIPMDARPGLYSLLLEIEGKEEFAIPFIVSTDTEKSQGKVLVMASTNTWQSYNLWGGRSRYRNFEESSSRDFLDQGKTIQLKKRVAKLVPNPLKIKLKKWLGKTDVGEPWMFKRLTIKRPYTNCMLEGKTPFEPFMNHLAAGEWRLLAWLERENIPYDIIAGAELNNNSKILENYKSLVFNTHCEYWTRKMYEAVKEFHENQGGWIINLSGNTMYREIEFFQDGSTRCISLSFNKSCADETQLLGVRYTAEDYGTCAPFKVTMRNHWAFNNISVEKNTLFGNQCLNRAIPKRTERYDSARSGLQTGLLGAGASGWEMDKLSKTAPKDIKVIAKGQNKNGGADMVVREPSNTRGGLFSASSLVFSSCLLVDEIASGIVRNIMKRALGN